MMDDWDPISFQYDSSYDPAHWNGNDVYATELFTVEEFRQAVRAGLYNDYDGTGYYTNPPAEHSRIPVNLSELVKGISEPSYTHVEWFNK